MSEKKKGDEVMTSGWGYVNLPPPVEEPKRNARYGIRNSGMVAELKTNGEGTPSQIADRMSIARSNASSSLSKLWNQKRIGRKEIPGIHVEGGAKYIYFATEDSK